MLSHEIWQTLEISDPWGGAWAGQGTQDVSHMRMTYHALAFSSASNRGARDAVLPDMPPRGRAYVRRKELIRRFEDTFTAPLCESRVGTNEHDAG